MSFKEPQIMTQQKFNLRNNQTRDDFIIRAINDGWCVRRLKTKTYEFMKELPKNTDEVLDKEPKNITKSKSIPITKNDFLKYVFSTS